MRLLMRKTDIADHHGFIDAPVLIDITARIGIVIIISPAVPSALLPRLCRFHRVSVEHILCPKSETDQIKPLLVFGNQILQIEFVLQPHIFFPTDIQFFIHHIYPHATHPIGGNSSRATARSIQPFIL